MKWKMAQQQIKLWNFGFEGSQPEILSGPIEVNILI